MAKVAGPPVPAVVPHITVEDAAAAIDFYKRAFGATEIARHPAPDGKRIMHASISINGAPVMLNDDFPEYCGGKSKTPRALGGSAAVIHLNVSEVDAAWARALKAGAEVVMPLADQFWGDRYGMLRDPQGHEWSMSGIHDNKKLSQAEIDKGAEKAFAKKPSSSTSTKWPATVEAKAAKSTAKKAAKKAVKKR